MKKVILFEREEHIEYKLPTIFNKTKEELTKVVELLQEWMKTQPNLPEIMDFVLLRQIFVNNKCSNEVTKKRIDMYYTIRSKMPDLFENANPKLPQTKQVLDNHFSLLAPVALPKLTTDMNRIFVFKMETAENLKLSAFQIIISFFTNMFEMYLRESYHLNNIIIVDFLNIRLEMVKNFSPMLLLKLLAFNEFQHAIKYRIHEFYIITRNSLSFAKISFEILRKIIKPKIFQKIQFCDEEFIRNRFPKEILPEDYGGEQKSLKTLHDLTKLKLLEYQEIFDQLDNMKADENLRPEKLENDDFLGFYGSFKKLTID